MRYLLAALFLVIAAEELNWGQRLMNVSTPESIAAVNVQGELSLHNLRGVHGVNRILGLMFIACYCFALPVLVKRSRVIQNLCESWKIPIMSFQAIGWLTAGIVAMVVPRVFGGEVIFELDEMGEFLLSVGFLHFVMIEFTRSSQTSTH
jgi:hypothetical protein